MSRWDVTHRTTLQRPFGMIPAAALAAALLSPPARATVLEIADDGAVVIYDRARTAPAPPTRQHLVAPAVRAAPAALRLHFDAAADAQALAPDLVEAVAWAESRFRQDAVSPSGARGVMQLMPATARDLRVNPAETGPNIRGGTAYLRLLLDRYAGDAVKTLAAYNAGPGAVDRFGGVPPYRETRAYVETILARLARRAAGQ